MKRREGGLYDVSQYSDGKKRKVSSICARDNKSFSLHLIIQMFREPHGGEEKPVPTSFKARDKSPNFSLPATLKSHAKYQSINILFNKLAHRCPRSSPKYGINQTPLSECLLKSSPRDTLGHMDVKLTNTHTHTHTRVLQSLGGPSTDTVINAAMSTSKSNHNFNFSNQTLYLFPLKKRS